MTIYVNTTSWDSIPNWAAIVEHDPTAASHSWPSKKLEQSSSQHGLERQWAVGADCHLSIVVGNEFHSKLRVCSYYKGNSNLFFSTKQNQPFAFLVFEMVWGIGWRKVCYRGNYFTSSNNCNRIKFANECTPTKHSSKGTTTPCPIKQHIFTPPAALVGYD